jgi:hypothetical protein
MNYFHFNKHLYISLSYFMLKISQIMYFYNYVISYKSKKITREHRTNCEHPFERASSLWR